MNVNLLTSHNVKLHLIKKGNYSPHDLTTLQIIFKIIKDYISLLIIGYKLNGI